MNTKNGPERTARPSRHWPVLAGAAALVLWAGCSFPEYGFVSQGADAGTGSGGAAGTGGQGGTAGSGGTSGTGGTITGGTGGTNTGGAGGTNTGGAGGTNTGGTGGTNTGGTGGTTTGGAGGTNTGGAGGTNTGGAGGTNTGGTGGTNTGGTAGQAGASTGGTGGAAGQAGAGGAGGSPSGLVINEIDYDQNGADAFEFVEIFNGSSSPADLTGLALVFVNGAPSVNDEYNRVDLSGTLAVGGYLVVATAAVSVDPGATNVLLPFSIQNGPDGVAIFNTVNNTLVDAFSYGGSVVGCTIANAPGTFDLVEGQVATVADSETATRSLVRMPNGSDTNDASIDWAQTSTVTPGAENQ